MASTNSLLISVVVPVYRGKAYLKDLVAALSHLKQSLLSQNLPLNLGEAIFVDDGSSDGSLEVLRELSSQNEWVRIVPLSRNFGQHSATVAGILHSSGDWVVTMDEDLQHHPKFVPTLLAHAIKDQMDVIYAHPESGVHESLMRDFSSKFYKTIISKLSGNPQVKKFNSFRLMRGNVARGAGSVATHVTYFDVAVSWFSNRCGTVSLPLKDQRFLTSKQSGYNLKSLLRHGWRMLISSEVKILRLGVAIGIATLILSCTFFLWALFKKLMYPETIDVKGWTSLILATLFLGGLTSFLVGMCLEYLSHILQHTLGKPTFFIVDRSKDALIKPYLGQLENADSFSKSS